MPESQEGNRCFGRFQLPVVIEAPELAEVPLVPEDISAGGFGVVLPVQPGQGKVVECVLQVAGEVFRNCRAKVVWVEEDAIEGDAWRAGLAVELADEARTRLEEVLQGLRAECRKAH